MPPPAARAQAVVREAALAQELVAAQALVLWSDRMALPAPAISVVGRAAVLPPVQAAVMVVWVASAVGQVADPALREMVPTVDLVAAQAVALAVDRAAQSAAAVRVADRALVPVDQAVARVPVLVEVPAQASRVALGRVPAVAQAVVRGVGPGPVGLAAVAVDPEVADPVAAQVVLAVGRAISLPLWAPSPLAVLPLVQELS